jgi:outer membrane protein
MTNLKILSIVLVIAVPPWNLLYASNPVLDEYIRSGLESNLSLQQKREDYRMSVELLNEAKSLFYPSLTLNMRYTMARGGRVIEFPAGDLLNPVYSTLNMLTGTQDFTRVENESFYFYRPREQESKISFIQPVIHPETWYNKRIRDREKELGSIDIEIYKRHLVAEIKKAYFQYLQSLYIEKIIRESILIIKQNIRVTGILAANDKVTPDYIHRAQAELGNAEQELAGASGKIKVSAAWFNFLLNRPLDQEIITAHQGEPDNIILNLHREERFLTDRREELQKAQNMVLLSEEYIGLKRAASYPRLTAVVEYGFQGERYSFGRDNDFALASLVFSWPLFEGFRNRSAIQQAQIRKNMAELIQAEVGQQLNMEIINAWYELEAADKAVEAASARLNSARSAFRITERRFNEGAAPLIEFNDARTTMTNAEINLVISRFDFHVKFAEYERAAALFDFDKEDPS